MSIPTPTVNVFDREFLGVRSRLIELAAALDRIGRCGGPASGDPRPAQVLQALEILAQDAPDRTKQIQQLFSLPNNQSG